MTITARTRGAPDGQVQPPPPGGSRFAEVGTLGLDILDGFVSVAYITDLEWPEVYEEYNRLRRADPEVSMVRQMFVSLAREVELDWQLPDDPTPDDERAQEYGRQVLDDLEGGASKWLEEVVSYVPFMGWGWWEAPLGIRDPEWRPPSRDTWRSRYDDGLITVRRFAFRDHSSLLQWWIDENTGRLSGMVQDDPPNPQVTIPLERSLHLTFGDRANPEGLSPLEALWRLERVKYGLEIILGLGYEHAAGYLDVTSEKKKLTEDDKAYIRQMARAIMTAQEGNYAAWPAGFMGEIKDITFQAGVSLLEAIRYYGMLKLQLFNSQWMAMATTADTGAFSAVQDASAMFLSYYNAMMAGFVQQADDQIGKRLFDHPIVKSAFPGMTTRPKLKASQIEKLPDLTQLSSFLNTYLAAFPVDDDDILAIRRKSRVLPERLPDVEAPPPIQEAAPEEGEEVPEEEEGGVTEEVGGSPEAEAGATEEEEVEAEEAEGELALRPFTVSDEEASTITQHERVISETDIEDAVRAFDRWAQANRPRLYGLLRAQVEEEEDVSG